MSIIDHHDGYYRFAAIAGDRVFFVCEDDIWSVPAAGGAAQRLTTGRGEFSMPRVSPDGKYVAFVGREEGHPEVFLIPAEGGLPRRLTYLGADVLNVVGWSSDSQSVHFICDDSQAFFRATDAFRISAAGGSPECFHWGHVASFDLRPDGRAVVGRNASDPARWKRYRGGTSGDIWIDRRGNGKFERLLDLEGNAVWPMLIGERVYFLSDHEGIGNIYSCRPDGSDLEKHTHQNRYYARFPSTDGKRIAYTAGGDIFVFDPRTGKETKVEVRAPASTYQIQRKFVRASEYLEDYSPHPDGHSVALIMRGQPLTLGNFEGPVLQHGEGSRVRYRLCEWLPDGKRFVVLNDRDGFERLELHYADQSNPPRLITAKEMGRITALSVSGDGTRVAMSNHRYELIVVDIEKGSIKTLDRSPAERIAGFEWSPDSNWIAYSWASHPDLFIIRVVNVSTGAKHDITEPVRADVAPSWDPDGRYLYFLGSRDFYPVLDSMSFDYGFPKGRRPFLVTLRKDVPSPFLSEPRAIPGRKPSRPQPEAVRKASASRTAGGDAQMKRLYKKALDEAYRDLKNELEKSKRRAKPAPQKAPPLKIDFDGIESRVLAFPVPEGRYGQILGARGRVLFTLYPVQGIRPDFSWYDEDRLKANLMAYDFEDEKSGVIFREINELKLSFDYQTLYYRSGKRIRAVDASEKIPGDGRQPQIPSTIGRETGLLDLGRAQVMVSPQAEWAQMYDEAWRLQKEHFWDERMSDIDWDLVREKYSCLLHRIRTRSEVSDLIWEMQGELGTSHAYEMGGDYRRSPWYRQGFLGADLTWDARRKGYRIERICRGDSWDSDASSPLSRPGLDVSEGDVILAVNGYQVSAELSVGELLLNQAGKEVSLTLVTGRTRPRTVTVKTLRHERALRYRDWVESNRRYVHEKTRGRIGYIHIPDMGPLGFAEFHRGYLAEVNREGLVVDVRYNRGGHVSPLLLEKLARKRVGYDVSRWGPPHPYPQESVAGPMVALTNEFAGSDGDIFSHCFKLYKLGPLVGRRTWGGVIGIWPRHRLVDGTITTQPEFSFWFADVGWGVENYGTDPDYVVDIPPHDFAAGRDPQMDRAIELIQKDLKSKPFKLPDFSQKPSLPLPDSPNGRRNGRPGRQSASSKRKSSPGSKKAGSGKSATTGKKAGSGKTAKPGSQKSNRRTGR